MKKVASVLLCSAALGASAAKVEKPNIVIFFADDISAREIPVYGSKVWTDLQGHNTSDPQYRAKMPVLDQLANQGCWIKTAWAATVCNPSRAMMMTGRYAYQTKWWNNKDKGYGRDENGNISTWPVYMSSPLLMGHVAQKAGYATMWSGKTQMAGSNEAHGFDEGCFTPGDYGAQDNPYTDFRHDLVKGKGRKDLINADTGKRCTTYLQNSWYWNPHVQLMNHPSAPNQSVWWPNTPKEQKVFSVGTFGPDIELQFAFDFMERKQREGKPFLVYHTTHLGHDGYNWLDPDTKIWPESKWPGTPIVNWDGKKYTRVTPNITGDNGVYDTHGTITGPGQFNHLNYIDYQIWLYRNKLEKMGIADNTVFIFCADNGTSGFGKNKGEQQKGCHIPLVIYAPGMTKHGEQDVLVSLADIMPTVADLVGFNIPDDYKLDGQSLMPLLYGNQTTHRQWIYSYRGPEQIVRGTYVLKDGFDKWYDVSKDPASLDNFSEIKDWGNVMETHHAERKELMKVLPQYDLYYTEYNEPGVNKQPSNQPQYARKAPDGVTKQKKQKK